ncbi:ADP-ribosyltransferase [Vibrio splendidus]|uniref:ADP-ribosyltransferase n=1 Tax=Vibrio splendidus TaxID=29497 RepID=UPI00148C1BAD|nr:ADP-ribosyltransferase [Vibrio splendidus]NOJ06904.1 NAD(+)--arginine ADP-ribosyltransferase [Vibrio splendidus]
MNTRFLLLLCCLSFASFSQPFDSLKQPGRSPEEIAKLAQDFKDWSNASNGWRHTLMTSAEKEAIEDFSVSGYLIANDYLRAAETSTWGVAGVDARQYIRTVKSALNKLPKYRGTAYRGSWVKQSLLNRVEVGDILIEPAFTSTTTIPEVARRFTAAPPSSPGQLKRVVFEVKVSKGGHTIAGLSEYSNEAEVLFAPNAHFRITEIERTSGSTYIGVETISSSSMKSEGTYNLFSGEEVEMPFWHSLICK